MKRFFSLILLAAFLTACQSSHIAEWVVPAGGVLFHDDFSDPSSNWARIAGKGGAMDYENGRYRIVVTAQNYDLWSFSGHSYRDVRAEVEATRMAGPVENLFGLTCRSQQDNYYFFAISSDGYFALGKVKYGVSTLIGQEMMEHSLAILPEATNTLRFDCIGEVLSGYINGQPVATVKDTDFQSGDVGLIAGTFDQPGADIAFDNFIVTKP